jgi:hypothetical protein
LAVELLPTAHCVLARDLACDFAFNLPLPTDSPDNLAGLLPELVTVLLDDLVAGPIRVASATGPVLGFEDDEYARVRLRDKCGSPVLTSPPSGQNGRFVFAARACRTVEGINRHVR